jgi:hypothetical protein
MSLLSDITGDSDTDAQNYLNQAANAYQSAAVPTIGQESVNNIPLESVQGTVSANPIAVAQQAPSAYNNISIDPATRAAQMQALTQYQQIANTAGLDPASALAMQQIVNAANVQNQGAQGAIQQQAQEMGQGGGDFALTQRAIAAQGASNNAATQGMQAAAEAAANRQAALSNMANIGANLEGSDYAMAQNKAAAQNTINATNQAATNTANTGNVQNQITTGTTNLQNAQNVNAANTTAGQNQVYYNAALPQQQFNNELSKAGGIAGVAGQQAGAAQQAQNANLGFAGSLLGTAGTIAGGALGGPIGATIGSTLAKGTLASPASSSSAPIGGGNSTPTGGNAQASNYGLAKGGVVCYASGGAVDTHDHAICMKLGSYVPGKAAVDGDSEKNDTVPAMLSPGELVIPRSVPKDGPHMEQFAKNAPVPGTGKKVDLTSFTTGYKRGK